MASFPQHELAVPRFAGRFEDGPLAGLEYSTNSVHGVIGPDGVFWYRAGEVVTFRIGSLVLGAVPGTPVISVAGLAGQAPGTSLRFPQITNRAVLLQSLTLRDGEAEPDAIGEAAARLISGVAGSLDFGLDEDTFAQRLAESGLFAETGRRVRSGPEARNCLRRALAGIEKRRDVEIPMRDGTILSADVFLPTRVRGPVPALVRLGVYGKAFGFGSAVTPEQQLGSEAREDEWFEGDRSSLPWIIRYSENLNSPNTTDWVPRGYAVIRVDGRGIGKSGGTVSPFSRQEAEDYYDVIEWVAGQPWCDGKVGLKGSSYQSVNQWAVAAMRPPALRAIAPFATDQDFYRDLTHAGGLYHAGFWRDWWPNMVLSARPNGEGPFDDFLTAIEDHPFDGDWWAAEDTAPVPARLEDIDVPVLAAVSMMGIVHGRGGFEAFRRLRGEKHLTVVDAAYASYEHHDTLQDQFDFFDKHLKGHAKELPPVRILVRKGGDEIDWRESASWPPTETDYQYLHLDAAHGTATSDEPPADTSVEYPADPAGLTSTPGAYFLSEPLAADTLLAGHFTARIVLSSSTSDADVFVSVRAFDGDDEVRFSTRDDSASPISWGFLKASHRAVDEDRSTIERPWHTHTEKDQAPLRPGEPVDLLVELLPATALVRAGWRLRIDVTPIEPGTLGQYFEGVGRVYDSYHTGATNRVHTGRSPPSWIRLPVLPFEQ